MPPTFTSLREQLNSTAEYAQSDAASELFDVWFAYAAEFAQTGSSIIDMQRHTRTGLEIMLTTYSTQRIRDPSTDLYAVRELMRHAQAIFEILRTKPKFTPLLDPMLYDGEKHNSLSHWLVTTGVRSLEAIAYTETLHSGVRVDALSTIQSLLELWEFLCTGPWEYHYSSSLLLTFHLDQLAQTLSSVSTDSIVRDACLQTIQQIARFEKGYMPVIALSRVARDVLALSPLWSMGLLSSSVAMDNIMSKMAATSTDHAASKSLYCTAVMESLYEALMNNKSSREWTFDARLYEPNLYQLFATCLQTYRMHPNESNRVVLPDAYLYALESVLLNHPDCISLVRFALNAKEHSLVFLVSRLAHVFHENVWTELILPFARAELAHLPLQGVSGSQRDQETVNMIREACRLYYINIDRIPSALLGKNLFLTVTQAIRHGYYETERFTEILALILHRHYSMNHVQVYQWIPTLLLPEVSHNHKTSRALNESLLIALGLQNSAFGLENAIMSAETSKAISDAFSVILAKLRSRPADLFWHEICLNFGQFIQEHRAALSALLHSIGMELDNAEIRGSIAVDRLDSLTDLLHAVSLRIDSSDAHMVLRLSLQVIQIGAGASTAAAFEDTLVNAINLLPEKAPLDLILTELALSICGPRTRAAIAEHTPHLCLEDIDPDVRKAAYKHIVNRPDLIQVNSVAVIRSLFWIHNSMSVAEDTSAKLCVDQLALATEACPVLVVLASVAPIYVKECVTKLLSAANITALNDPLNEARFISPHLDSLVENVPRNALIRFLLAPSGLSLLPILVYLSPKWQQFAQEMIQSGLLTESDNFFPMATTEYACLERMLKVSRTYRCTVQGQNTLVQIMGAEHADTAQTVPSRNQLHQLIVAEESKGGYMKALRLANTMRAWYPDDYAQLGTNQLVRQVLLPRVQEYHFPRMQQGCTKASLDAFPSHYRIMHEVKLLFPQEAEEVLELSHQIDAFCLAKLHEILTTCGQDEARAWMDMYDFHIPIATSLVTDTPIKTKSMPAIAVPVQPSAPLWAETMLHVLDGELPAIALDNIALEEPSSQSRIE